MTQAEFLFLGTGASSGVPMIGCRCAVCTSSDIHNKRLRPSALITCKNKKLLIDSGPDFRFQALNYKIDHLDGMLLTHSHFDHIAGLDELRIYYLRTKNALPVLLSKATFEDVKRRYYYLFQDKNRSVSLTAQLEFHVLEKMRGSTQFLGLKIDYMQYEQAKMPVTGFRLGSLAYLSDIREYPETVFADLAGVKTLILSMLKKEVSPMHFNIQEGIEFARKAGAKKTYFTHMGHELDYAATNAELPYGFQLGYDGLKLEFEYE